jgi:hypothetical protein
MFTGSIVAATKKTQSKLATTGEQQTDTATSSDSRRLSVNVLRSGKTLIPGPVIAVSEIENKEGLLTPSNEQPPDSAHICTFLPHTPTVTDCICTEQPPDSVHICTFLPHTPTVTDCISDTITAIETVPASPLSVSSHMIHPPTPSTRAFSVTTPATPNSPSVAAVLQAHGSRDCTVPFPKREGYCTVQKPLQVDIDAFENKKEASGDKRASSSSTTEGPAKKRKKEAAASIVPTEQDAGDDSDDSNAIAFLQGEGDTTGGDLRGHHLYWNCCVLAPNSEFPVNTTALLDCGAHVVLIRDTLVDELGLQRHPLKDTFSVRGAMSTGRSSLKEFVVLSLSSVDLYYTARNVKALIVDELSSPIILGMPFLTTNAITIDHELRIVTDKRQKYNLLGPNDLPPKQLPKRKRVPAERSREEKHQKNKLLMTTARYRRQLLDDLKERLMATKLAMTPYTHASDAQVVVAAIHERITSIIDEEILRRLHDKVTLEFAPLFADMPNVSALPKDIEAEIILKDPTKVVKPRTYSCPRRYKQAWKRLIDEHLDAGRIRPSDSAHTSPSFCIPKADPDAPPRWVNDYRELNRNTVPDNYTLPKVDDVLNDCAQGKFFAVIDMTSAFFQTRMRKKDIGKTAVSTPFGSYEWVVMPMGLRNAPAIHQRRINKALRQHIGKICRVYLDDIVIWSQSLQEHEHNVHLILQTLRDAGLFCNLKKTKLFCTEINFLGHKISAKGIEADDKKADRILNWPVPKSAKEVRRFLGLVRYLAVFLPDLARFSTILSKLTERDCDDQFPDWNDSHQSAFDSIKQLVLSRDCLTTIDYDTLEDNRIFVATDASDVGSGAVLSFGRTFESARPVAFESKSFKKAELNYPVHEKELLAIVRALEKWRVDLIGVPFTVLTDHRTLECFQTQRHMSRRQARWMEFLQQYDFTIVYLRGEDNTAADALSRTAFPTTTSEADAFHMSSYDRFDELEIAVCGLLGGSTSAQVKWASTVCALGEPAAAATSGVAVDDELRTVIKTGYQDDSWCSKLLSTWRNTPNVTMKGDLLFFEDRLVIPRAGNIRETIFTLAHDSLGHFGLDKSYEALRGSFYWPGMYTDLERIYVPRCDLCQRIKSSTKKPFGPLHPLPVPDHRLQAVAMDFVGPLPVEDGFDCILTITDRLGADVRLIPTTLTATAADVAQLFYTNWYCENGLPLEIVSDRDKLFTSSFWRSLHALTGTSLKMSSSFHPETDGASERTNKTLNQCLRAHVDGLQRGWVKALPTIRFSMMNTQNASTGLTGFQLRMGLSPRVIPPLVEAPISTPESPEQFLERMRVLEAQARDCLLQHKVTQAFHANKNRDTQDLPFRIGDRVKLSTVNRRKTLSTEGKKRVAKLLPRFEGPYVVRKLDVTHNSVTLEIPRPGNAVATETFHTSLIRPWVENDDVVFERPPPDDKGEAEVEEIIERRPVGRGWSYRVKYQGYPIEESEWLPGKEVADLAALDRYFARMGLDEHGHQKST